MLHQIPPSYNAVPYLDTLMGPRGKALSGYRVSKKSTPEDNVHDPGHRRWRQSLVSYAASFRTSMI